MKPPYVRISAECHNHGQFQVDRKPNKRKDAPSKGREGLYDAVKCPVCPYWARIIDQQIVAEEDQNPGDGSAAAYFLPGLEA